MTRSRLPEDLTISQFEETVKFMKHWEKRTAKRHGYWFKRLGNDTVEIINEAQNTVWTIDYPYK